MKIKALTVAALLTLLAVTSPAQTVNLTGLNWKITGLDEISWNGSDLFFTTQTPTATGYNLAGYFDWYSGGSFRGRELFTGTLTSTLDLHLDGYEVSNPLAIQRSIYDGDVTPEGTRIINGTWVGISGSPHGVWSATVVPEPSSIALLALGGIGAVLVVRRKRSRSL